jgi:hypothetical protein
LAKFLNKLTEDAAAAELAKAEAAAALARAEEAAELAKKAQLASDVSAEEHVKEDSLVTGEVAQGCNKEDDKTASPSDAPPSDKQAAVDGEKPPSDMQPGLEVDTKPSSFISEVKLKKAPEQGEDKAADKAGEKEGKKAGGSPPVEMERFPLTPQDSVFDFWTPVLKTLEDQVCCERH